MSNNSTNSDNDNSYFDPDLWDAISSAKKEDVAPKKNLPKVREGPTASERLMEYLDKPKNVTPVKLDTYFRKLKMGNPPEIAAQLATFKHSDVVKWLDRGERYEDSWYSVFLEEYQSAVAQCFSACTNTVMRAIKANRRDSPRLAMEMMKMLETGKWTSQGSGSQINNIEVNNPNALHQQNNAYLSINSPEIAALEGLSDDAFESAFGDLGDSNNSVEGVIEE